MLKFFSVVIIIVLIVGAALFGVQSMGIQIPYVSEFFTNMMPSGGHAGHQMVGMPGMQSGNIVPPSAFNNVASQNKDKLIQATTILNQAMDLITTDPYSQITQPSQSSSAPSNAQAPNSTNIPAREGVNININQGGQQRTVTSSTGNVVYDQAKMEQLHTSIFKFSQASMLLNEINNDLTDQSLLQESSPPTNETYVMRYNLTQKNRTKLVQANRLLQEAVAMANVNPYAPQEGYIYNPQKMQQLHQGIYEFARSTLILSQLSEDFNQQMTQISNEAKLFRMQPGNTMAGMTGMSGMTTQHGMMSGSENSWIFHVAIIIIVFGIVLGVLVLIKRLINDAKSA